ncbi:MAG: hypothetical protein IT158_04030 [Bryobacterales bacterium]|nr:hypothetical protein [Bryobacterales bacterium]
MGKKAGVEGAARTRKSKAEAAEEPVVGKEPKQLVEEAIRTIGEQLKDKKVRATLGDLIRLLQLQKELRADEAREIKVTWVEPGETEPATEK